MGAGKYRGRAITETAFVSVRDSRVRISERANSVDGHILRRATSVDTLYHDCARLKRYNCYLIGASTICGKSLLMKLTAVEHLRKISENM